MSRSPVSLIVLSVISACAAAAQQPADQAIARLGDISDIDAGNWKFKHPAVAGGHLPDFDDSDWATVRPEHRWEFENSQAWYRKTVRVPDAVGGVSVAGSNLTLRCAVDDDMEVFVDGESRGKFHWDEGRAVLTEDARPGQQFLVAIRAINAGGPGRLLWAHLSYSRFDGVRDLARQQRQRLAFARRLLDVPSAADRRDEYAQHIDEAANAIDFAALEKDNTDAFERSLQASTNRLQPLSELAKQYTIFLVGHAHIDMNWLWLWPETKQVCRQTWRQALEFMDEYEDFKFTQSQPGAYIAIEHENPELFERIQKAADRGQWELAGASWVEGDTNMASGEALARHCLLTHDYFIDRFGHHSEVAWLPDNFGHAWTVPSIFADAGYRYFYFCRAGKGTPLFWWQAPDGRRLLAYNHRWYNERFTPGHRSVPLEVESRIGLPACMIVYGVGDHGGGPTREDIETARDMRQEPIAPKITFAKATEFFSYAEKAAGDDLPVIDDELNFTFEGCYTSHGDVKYWNRYSENVLPTAETIAAICSQWGANYPADDFTQAWRNTCFNQFHDILPGTAIHDSYKYSRKLFDEAAETADMAITDGLTNLAERIDTRGPGRAVLLWNPVAWERTEYIEVDLKTENEWPGARVIDGNGAPITCQVLGSSPNDGGYDTRIAFVTDLPATGYAMVHVSPADAVEAASPFTAGDAVISGRCGPLQVAVDKRSGTVTQLAHSGTDRAYIRADNAAQSRGAGQLQILHEQPHGMSAWTIGRISDTKALNADDVRIIADGPVCTKIAVKHTFKESSFDQTITFYRDLPRIDFDMTADWQEVGTAERGGPFLKAAFPLAIDNPKATFEIPWGSIVRATNGHEVPAQKWINVAETVRIPTEDGRDPAAIDVSGYFNEDVIATLDDPDDGDFDDGSRAYGAEIITGIQGDSIIVGDVPFNKPPVEAGRDNCVRAEGQTITWPAESCSALAVLGASSNGRHGGPAKLLYADGSEQSVVLEFSDWCGGPGPDETRAASLDYRIDAGGKAEPANSIWMRRIDADPEKRLRGIALPEEPNLHIFGLAFARKVERRPTWGVSLLNDCKYGFDVNGSVMRISLLRCSYNPDPRPDQGIHNIRYSLYPHDGDWRAAKTPRKAFEFNNPVIVREVAQHDGDLPPRQQFLRIQPDSMILSAFKRAADGEGYIARVYNATGSGGQATLQCNLPFAEASACDILERARGNDAATAAGDAVTLDLNGRIHGTMRLTP